ncbi:hypothetical protein L208DRAFT_1460341, partial [Tricholoma matsutake]
QEGGLDSFLGRSIFEERVQKDWKCVQECCEDGCYVILSYASVNGGHKLLSI